MKKALSLLALLLAVVMIAACFAACGDEEENTNNTDSGNGQTGDLNIVLPTQGDTAAVDQPTDAPTDAPTVAPAAGIVGRWRYVMEFSKFIEAQIDDVLAQVPDEQKPMYEELFEAYKGVSFDLYMEFDDNENYRTEIDEASVNAAVEQIKQNIKDHLPAIIAYIGYTMDQFEQALAAQNMTVDDYIDSAFSASIDEMKQGIAQANTSGKYRYESNRLYFSNAYGTFDDSQYVTLIINGNTARLTEIAGDSGTFTEAMLPMIFNRVQ